MRIHLKIWAAFAIAAALTACGGGNDTAPVTGGSQPVVTSTTSTTSTEQLAQTSTVAGLTYFYQQGVLPLTSGESYAAVGSPNYYDLNADLSLEDGRNDQFDGALLLSITSTSGTSTATVSGSFRSDQLYSELTFNTPEYGAANGSVGAYFTRTDALNASPTSTDIAAWLLPTPDSRLQQTVTFPASTGSLTLTWDTFNGPRSGRFSSEPNYYFRVVLRSNTGTVATLYEQTNGISTGTNNIADVTSFAGRTLLLSFEARSTQNNIRIDNVSLLNGATQVITNGDFSANGTGWQVNTPTLTQNVTSGTRTVAGLTVQRSVYVPPTEKWGRWTDVFSNPTASTIQATVSYSTDLGSDDSGIVYTTPNSNSKSVSSWDGRARDRDVAIVYGSVAQVTYTSATALNTSNGSEFILVDYPVTIGPGGSVSIVQFIILGDETTGQSAGVTVNSRATAVDGVAQDIVSNFRSNVKFRAGMTQRQLNSILNF
jgi:hypothetical protein